MTFRPTKPLIWRDTDNEYYELARLQFRNLKRPYAGRYLRVSTDKQAQTDIDPEGLSLPAQRASCLAKAKELGAEVIEEYVDRGESAKTADRPQFQAMIERISNQRDIQYVILDKIDRFARNRRDDANLLFELHSAGAKVISVKENIDDTPGGKLLHGVLASLAEYTSSNNGSEALKGMTQKAQVGGTPGKAPIGYLNHRIQIPGSPRGRATVIIDEERAPHIKWAFEQYATGEWSTRTLADALEARGLRTVGTSKRPSIPMHRSRIAHMLNNRYYTGIVTFKGAHYQGRHEPLVTNQQFEQVQAVLNSRALSKEKPYRHHHYLRGSVFCDICGSRLIYSKSKGNGGIYEYYKCIGGTEKYTDCIMRYVRSDWLEVKVEGLWSGNNIKPDDAQLLRDIVRDQLDHTFSGASQQLTTQTQRLQTLGDERTALLRAHLAVAPPLDLLKTEQDRIAKEIADTQIAIERASIQTRHIEQALTRALEIAQDCDQAYNQAPPQQRRYLNQSFYEKITVGPKSIHLHLNSPYKEIAGLLQTPNHAIEAAETIAETRRKTAIESEASDKSTTADKTTTTNPPNPKNNHYAKQSPPKTNQPRPL